MKKEWSGKTRGGTFGQKSLIFYFRHGSITFIYLILRVIVVFYMIFARKGRNAIYNYFRKIHSLPALRSLLMTYKNHYLFGQSMLDKYALFCGNTGKYNMSFEGRESFDEALTSDNAIIITSSHCGNFELAGYLMNQNLKKINAIAFGGESQVYQQARTDNLNKNNITLIPVADDLSHIYAINNALSNGEVLIVPGDRIFEGSRFTETDFMGRRARFPDGPFVLAARYNVSLFSLFVMKEADFKYKTYVKRLDSPDTVEMKNSDKSRLLTRRYVSALEEIVTMYPAQWYNFYKFWN